MLLDQVGFMTQIWIAVLAIRWTYAQQEDHGGGEETWLDVQMRRAMYFVFIMSFAPVIRAWFGLCGYHVFNATILMTLLSYIGYMWLMRRRRAWQELRASRARWDKEPGEE